MAGVGQGSTPAAKRPDLRLSWLPPWAVNGVILRYRPAASFAAVLLAKRGVSCATGWPYLTSRHRADGRGRAEAIICALLQSFTAPGNASRQKDRAMASPIRILLQTTIPSAEDDWHIGRFSLLRDHLAGLRDDAGDPLCLVTARDRSAPAMPDPVLSTIDRSDFDELWLFAVDTGDGLDPEDCAAIRRFREKGRGLLVTRDHMDLGSSICTLDGVGRAHFFHSSQPDPDPTRHVIDDRETTYISWPNYHSGANGDFQEITAVGAPHPSCTNLQRRAAWCAICPPIRTRGGGGADQ